MLLKQIMQQSCEEYISNNTKIPRKKKYLKIMFQGKQRWPTANAGYSTTVYSLTAAQLFNRKNA